MAYDFGNDRLFVAGYTTSFIFDAPSHNGGKDALILAFTVSTNTLIWSRVIGTVGDEEVVKLAFYNQELYAVGMFDDEIPVDNQSPMISNGGTDIFVFRMDGNGVITDSTQIGTSSEDIAKDFIISGGHGLIVGASGDYVTMWHLATGLAIYSSQYNPGGYAYYGAAEGIAFIDTITNWAVTGYRVGTPGATMSQMFIG